jgi:hypothetical protein
MSRLFVLFFPTFFLILFAAPAPAEIVNTLDLVTRSIDGVNYYEIEISSEVKGKEAAELFEIFFPVDDEGEIIDDSYRTFAVDSPEPAAVSLYCYKNRGDDDRGGPSCTIQLAQLETKKLEAPVLARLKSEASVDLAKYLANGSKNFQSTDKKFGAAC